MPELYLYAIVALSALVALGFYLVLRDDKQTRVETAQRKAVVFTEVATALAAPHAFPPITAAMPEADPLSSAEPSAPPPRGATGAERATRRREVAEQRPLPAQPDQGPMQALVTHLSREVEELRAERASLKEEVRQLRGALADAMMANREATPAPAHANVYNLPTKRVS